MSNETSRSVPDLLGDLVEQTSSLVRKEVQLARAEMGEKATSFAAAGVALAGGAIFLLAALIILLQAAVTALVEYANLTATSASLIVAGVVAVIGYLMLRKGRNQLRPYNLSPDRTVKQLSRDAQVIKEQVR